MEFQFDINAKKSQFASRTQLFNISHQLYVMVITDKLYQVSRRLPNVILPARDNIKDLRIKSLIGPSFSILAFTSSNILNLASL